MIGPRLTSGPDAPVRSGTWLQMAKALRGSIPAVAEVRYCCLEARCLGPLLTESPIFTISTKWATTSPGNALFRPYGRTTGPAASGIDAGFSFQSRDHLVSGRGTSLPSTRIASTCSLKKHRRPLIFGHSGIGSG